MTRRLRTDSTLSRFVPATTAMAATSHRAATAPMPTLSGEWYLAARLAVRIWVRSPHSARKMTPKAVVKVRSPVRAALTEASSSASLRCRHE
jgi:hypothetical protein